MKKNKVWIVAVLLVFAAGLLTGYTAKEAQLGANAEEVVEEIESDRVDLKLPGETEKRIVTVSEVKAELIEIGQLATYSGEYSVVKSVDDKRYLLDSIPILGTTNTIRIECTGLVKVGYDMDEIQPTVDNESQRIYIALPEPKLLDNYVIWDSISCKESNNPLNPISFSQYEALIDELEQEGLEQVENKGDGIYSEAAENAKNIIRHFLSGFDEYEIIFL